MTAHMENGNNMKDNDMQELRGGMSALGRKLQGQNIIDEAGMEKLKGNISREIRKIERNYLSSAISTILTAPVLPFVLHRFCGFSWWLCGTFGFIVALSATDSFIRYRRLHEIDFAGSPVIQCGRQLADYRLLFLKQQKLRLAMGIPVMVWMLAETFFVIDKEYTVTVLAGIALTVILAAVFLIPQKKDMDTRIRSFCSHLDEFSDGSGMDTPQG